MSTEKLGHSKTLQDMILPSSLACAVFQLQSWTDIDSSMDGDRRTVFVTDLSIYQLIDAINSQISMEVIGRILKTNLIGQIDASSKWPDIRTDRWIKRWTRIGKVLVFGKRHTDPSENFCCIMPFSL